jgi:hypothetical protein
LPKFSKIGQFGDLCRIQPVWARIDRGQQKFICHFKAGIAVFDRVSIRVIFMLKLIVFPALAANRSTYK